MTRSSQALAVVAVALGLAFPGVAEAQRGGGHGGGGGGHAVSRSGSTGGGFSSGARPVSSSSGTATAPATPPRTRSGQPTTGTASPRMLGTVTGLPGAVFGPFGLGYPFYTAGFGYGFGFAAYDPFFYDGLGFGFGYGPWSPLYGPWNDPFVYDPMNPFGYGYSQFAYGYPGYGYPDYGYGGYAAPPAGSDTASISHETGSLRLKVSPDTAKVYVDGVLAGTANEFDGLFSHHLVVETGSHQLELRADGYETYQETITVDSGKTFTERISMKKSK